MRTTYLFTSERLGFRSWTGADIAPMAAVNADPEVMRFFPATQSADQTVGFVQRMQAQLAAKGFCYFAVDELLTGRFIGFIGLSEQTFAADFTPCIDIGWRLAKIAWGKGYATEGAQSCLAYGFEQAGLKQIHAIAPAVNLPSVRVMQKIGMQFVQEFKHPLLKDNKQLEDCVLYRI
jgi:RimJ/RimL family protein N-acetyltransferase